MEDRSEVWARKLERLQENIERARAGASVSELASELSLDELIELNTYSGHLNASVREVIMTALRLKETESTPAALSAQTAISALKVSYRSLEINDAAFKNAVKQRNWSIGMGITAIVVSVCALIATSYIAYFKVAEVSGAQEARIKADIVAELRPGQKDAITSDQPADHAIDLGRNPFVPRAH